MSFNDRFPKYEPKRILSQDQIIQKQKLEEEFAKLRKEATPQEVKKMLDDQDGKCYLGDCNNAVQAIGIAYGSRTGERKVLGFCGNHVPEKGQHMISKA